MSSINNNNETNNFNIFEGNINKNNSINNNFNNTLNKNMFKFKYVIGKGGFGKVWKVIYKKTKETFALKEMSKRKIINKKNQKSVINEMLLLKRLYHPFIVNMHYAFQDNDNLYLVIDFLSGGDLRYHCSRYRTFSEEQTRFFISCIILGLEHIHKNNIIHRDIKPENLVLDEKGYLRITDFGIAKINKENNSSQTSGTPGYMSPEVMRGDNHSFSADFFAIGVIGYEFMMGKRPYNGKNRKEIQKKMIGKNVKLDKNEINKGWSEESIDFINHLLEKKPELRLGNNNGIIELKEHPWMKYYMWKELEMKVLAAPFIPDKNDNFDKAFCEDSDFLTEETKNRNKKIDSSTRYENEFQNFYFNIEIEQRANNIKNENKYNKGNLNCNIKKENDIQNINIKKIIKTIIIDNNQVNKNKILKNIRNLLNESKNLNKDNNNNKNIQYHKNKLTKESSGGNLTINLKTNNPKTINNIASIKNENNNINPNKKVIIQPEKINLIHPYYNCNSNPSPTISIKNIFVNYFNSSSKSYNNIKKRNDYNIYKIYSINNNKNKNNFLLLH